MEHARRTTRTHTHTICSFAQHTNCAPHNGRAAGCRPRAAAVEHASNACSTAVVRLVTLACDRTIVCVRQYARRCIGGARRSPHESAPLRRTKTARGPNEPPGVGKSGARLTRRRTLMTARRRIGDSIAHDDSRRACDSQRVRLASVRTRSYTRTSSRSSDHFHVFVRRRAARPLRAFYFSSIGRRATAPVRQCAIAPQARCARQRERPVPVALQTAASGWLAAVNTAATM